MRTNITMRGDPVEFREVDQSISDTPSRGRYVIASALRTLELLKVFAQRPYRFTFPELTALTGLEKNQLYRSVKTLEEAGFLALDPDGALGLTSLLHRLSSASAHGMHRSLPDLAGPYLDELVAASGESAHLFVRNGDYAICVDRRDSPHMVRLASVLGVTAPLHAGAVPKAMLAFMPEDDQERILAGLGALPAYTERTVLDADALAQELAAIRERGYAISDEDYDASARGVGAPIFDDIGTVVAGISVGGPSFRVGAETLSAFGALVNQVAGDISRHLGQVT